MNQNQKLVASRLARTIALRSRRNNANSQLGQKTSDYRSSTKLTISVLIDHLKYTKLSGLRQYVLILAIESLPKNHSYMIDYDIAADVLGTTPSLIVDFYQKLDVFVTFGLN